MILSRYCALAGLVAVLAAPGMASAQTTLAVHLDLYEGDRMTKAFSQALRQAVAADSRFSVVDAAPADGVNVIMNDALQASQNDDVSTLSYHVTVKLGSGKFLKTLDGLCDEKKLDMCGRIVAADIYDAYSAKK